MQAERVLASEQCATAMAGVGAGRCVRRRAARTLCRLVVLMPIWFHKPHDRRRPAEDRGCLVGVLLIRAEDEALVLADEIGAVDAEAGRADIAILYALCVSGKHRDHLCA